MPVEADLVGDVRARELPRVIVLEPRVGRLELRAVGRDELLEDTCGGRERGTSAYCMGAYTEGGRGGVARAVR